MPKLDFRTFFRDLRRSHVAVGRMVYESSQRGVVSKEHWMTTSRSSRGPDHDERRSIGEAPEKPTIDKGKLTAHVREICDLAPKLAVDYLAAVELDDQQGREAYKARLTECAVGIEALLQRFGDSLTDDEIRRLIKALLECKLPQFSRELSVTGSRRTGLDRLVTRAFGLYRRLKDVGQPKEFVTAMQRIVAHVGESCEKATTDTSVLACYKSLALLIESAKFGGELFASLMARHMNGESGGTDNWIPLIGDLREQSLKMDGAGGWRKEYLARHPELARAGKSGEIDTLVGQATECRRMISLLEKDLLDLAQYEQGSNDDDRPTGLHDLFGRGTNNVSMLIDPKTMGGLGKTLGRFDVVLALWNHEKAKLFEIETKLAKSAIDRLLQDCGVTGDRRKALGKQLERLLDLPRYVDTDMMREVRSLENDPEKNGSGIDDAPNQPLLGIDDEDDGNFVGVRQKRSNESFEVRWKQIVSEVTRSALKNNGNLTEDEARATVEKQLSRTFGKWQECHDLARRCTEARDNCFDAEARTLLGQLSDDGDEIDWQVLYDIFSLEIVSMSQFRSCCEALMNVSGNLNGSTLSGALVGKPDTKPLKHLASFDLKPFSQREFMRGQLTPDGEVHRKGVHLPFVETLPEIEDGREYDSPDLARIIAALRNSPETLFGEEARMPVPTGKDGKRDKAYETELAKWDAKYGWRIDYAWQNLVMRMALEICPDDTKLHEYKPDRNRVREALIAHGCTVADLDRIGYDAIFTYVTSVPFSDKTLQAISEFGASLAGEVPDTDREARQLYDLMLTFRPDDFCYISRSDINRLKVDIVPGPLAVSVSKETYGTIREVKIDRNAKGLSVVLYSGSGVRAGAKLGFSPSDTGIDKISLGGGGGNRMFAGTQIQFDLDTFGGDYPRLCRTVTDLVYNLKKRKEVDLKSIFRHASAIRAFSQDQIDGYGNVDLGVGLSGNDSIGPLTVGVELGISGRLLTSGYCKKRKWQGRDITQDNLYQTKVEWRGTGGAGFSATWGVPLPGTGGTMSNTVGLGKGGGGKHFGMIYTIRGSVTDRKAVGKVKRAWMSRKHFHVATADMEQKDKEEVFKREIRSLLDPIPSAREMLDRGEYDEKIRELIRLVDSRDIDSGTLIGAQGKLKLQAQLRVDGIAAEIESILEKMGDTDAARRAIKRLHKEQQEILENGDNYYLAGLTLSSLHEGAGEKSGGFKFRWGAILPTLGGLGAGNELVTSNWHETQSLIARVQLSEPIEMLNLKQLQTPVPRGRFSGNHNVNLAHWSSVIRG